jgi:hypothetical protein
MKPSAEISFKKNVFFSKLEDRKVNQVLSGGWCQWERGRYKESMWEGKYCGNAMHSCMKVEK